MLKLNNIVKNYQVGDTVVPALKGVSLAFRRSEFVSILGASGCGKTTLLNIIGGLDRYTEGDLIIDGVSTREFTASDWDAYRNSSIGFVFQSYNLIPHVSVLRNVELALTLSGVSASERKRRATDALERVGLKDHLNKKPNQLSGGQMQRVAIARALVNDPEILLADEPTGALDSETSLQIMNILKEISRDRLIIMVTHNGELAEQYSSRIVSLKDGLIVGDTDPYEGEPERKEAPISEEEKKQRKKEVKKSRKKTSMSFLTALSLSGNNLVTKKGRTFLTSFAGSIGIIGIALVLAISNGFNAYINTMQRDTLAGFPITVSETAYDMSVGNMDSIMGDMEEQEKDRYPNTQEIYPYTPNDDQSSLIIQNTITEEYLEYVKSMDPSLYSSIDTNSALSMNVLRQAQSGSWLKVPTRASGNAMGATLSSAGWQPLISNQEFLLDQYDMIGGTKIPTEMNEVAIVVNSYNRLSVNTLKAMGIDSDRESISFEELIGMEYKVIPNNVYYEERTFEEGEHTGKNYYYDYGIAATSRDKYTSEQQARMQSMAESEEALTLKVTCILRVKENSTFSVMGTGLAYHPSLETWYTENAKESDVVKAQEAEYEASQEFGTTIRDVLDYTGTGKALDVKSYKTQMINLGGDTTPFLICIYPKDFASKTGIRSYLDAYNEGKGEAEQIIYSDYAETLTDNMNTMVDIISYVLIAFAAISLVVSSIMIGIITYVSVIERTKEIGILRSIGARKKDIARVFNAETFIIGLGAGLIGVLISVLLTIPINLIITSLVPQITNIAAVNPIHGVILVVISVCLTLISGLIPASVAAKKDPVEALRTE